jgi:excinuclease ABC subunit A
LHSEDIAKLLPIFHTLVDQGNTLIIIEHNLDLIAQADYIVDLGPDAGSKGGRIMAEGTPEEIAASTLSRTASYLQEHLQFLHATSIRKKKKK